MKKILFLLFFLFFLPLSMMGLFGQAKPPVSPPQVGTGLPADAGKSLMMDANGRGTLGLTWNVGGNAVSANGIIGTTSAYDVIFRTNNVNRLKISKDGWIGIGTDTSVLHNSLYSNMLNVKGGHGNARISLLSTGDGGINDAYMELWASEPDATYSGVGIGSNIVNYGTSNAFMRRNTALGGSYIRMNQDNLLFHTVSKTGADKRLIELLSDGTVGIGGAMSVNNSIAIGRQGGLDVTYFTGGAGYGSRIEQRGATGVSNNVLTGNSNCFLNSVIGNFGVGMTTPQRKLDVMGDMYLRKTLGSNNPVTQQHSMQFEIKNNIGEKSMSMGVLDNGIGMIQVKEAGIGYNSLLLNPVAGLVGIGVTSAQARLHVGGDLIQANNDYINGSTGSFQQFQQGSASGNTYSSIGAFSNGGNAWNNLILQSSGGNVGIGTINPSQKLSVIGTIRADLQAIGNSLVVTGNGSNLHVNHNGGSFTSLTNTGGGIQIMASDATTPQIRTTNGTNYFFGEQLFLATGSNNFNAALKNTGELGLGIQTPSNKLHVVGTNPARLEGLQTVTGSSDFLLTADATGVVRQRTVTNLFASAPIPSLQQITDAGGGATTGAISAGSISVTGNANVSGDITTLGKVNISGNMRIMGSIMRPDNSSIAANFGNGTNILLGEQKIMEQGGSIVNLIAKNSGEIGIGTATPTNKLHIVSSSNPLRLEGLQSGNATTDNLLSSDETGVVRKVTLPDLRNEQTVYYNQTTSEGSYTIPTKREFNLILNWTVTVGSFNFVLPSSSTLGYTINIYVKGNGTNMTGVTFSGALKDGTYPTSLTKSDHIKLVWDGSSWLKVKNN